MDIGGIIVGLGNPGIKYQNTRHNAGFIVLENFLKNISNDASLEKVSASKFSCVLFRADFRHQKPWFFAFPQTFMNLSGESVEPLLAWYKCSLDKLLIVHDELDLAPGRVQLKKGGGNAGHNGLKSISQRLNSQDYYRLRVGIGRPPDPSNVSSWVLGHFAEEKQIMEQAMDDSVNALHLIISNGMTKAMNEINIRKKEVKDLPSEK